MNISIAGRIRRCPASMKIPEAIQENVNDIGLGPGMEKSIRSPVPKCTLAADMEFIMLGADVGFWLSRNPFSLRPKGHFKEMQ